MVSILLSLALFLASAPASALQKQGKVRFFVTVRESSVSHGVQQRASDLEESAADVRRRLKKTKWTEVVETSEQADLEFRVLGRRTDPERGFILHYAIHAGAFETEDEFDYKGESYDTGGIVSSTSDGSRTMSGRGVLRWDELQKRLAESLERFAEANYDRIVSQRPPGEHP